MYAWVEEDWVEVAKLRVDRGYHAVSTIVMDDEILQFCGDK